MRVAVDLQACQTESRWRGIGRYAHDFSRAVVELRGAREVLLVLDGTYPASARELRSEFTPMVGPAGFRSYRYPGPNVAIGAGGDGLRPAAEALVRHEYDAMRADVVHANSLFEGFVEHAAGLGRIAGLPGAVASVTLYDLIPLVLPEWYLSDGAYRNWYLRKVQELARFDVVLCISEATRKAAIDLLGLPAERLVTINAGVSPELLNVVPGTPLPAPAARRFGIEGRYVLYTGNGDPRKNLAGAVQAFAALPTSLLDRNQLVLNQVGDEEALRRIAEQAGLASHRLVVTGRISDSELTSLLTGCEAFFFPSLYEGFGLPVLEAMACGAPAICGDNSSLPEVIGRSDAMFDASDPAAATSKLVEVLSDDGFRRELSESGRARAREFTWPRAAEIAWKAWEDAIARKRRPASVQVGRRLRIALVTPLPPERTGIADYVMELLPALRSRMDVELYTTAPIDRLADEPALHHARPWMQLEEEASRFDHVVYQVGNSPFHSHMLELMVRVPGTVVLHDFFLSSLLAYLDAHEGRAGLFAGELERSHGTGARQGLHTPEGWVAATRNWPASRLVFDVAESVLVHSAHAVALARRFYPGVAESALRHLPMPLKARAPDADARRRARETVGVRDDSCLIVSFGFLADTKLNLELIDAFGRLAARDRSLRLVFVGEPDGGAYGDACRARIAANPAGDRIHITGFVSHELYAEYLRAADVAVQLRASSRGETSKSVLDCMAHGIAVIVNDYASFAELPGHAVVKLHAEPDAQEIEAELEALVRSPELRRELGVRARAHIADAHEPLRVAAAYEAAIREALARRDEQRGHFVESLAHALDGAFDPDGALAAVEHALRSGESPRCPRLYIDVTDISQQDHGTGIHRVVRNLSRHLMLDEGPQLRCAPVVVTKGGDVLEASEFAGTLGIERAGRYGFEPASSDVLFLLDSTWTEPERFLSAIQRMRDAGGRVAAMVYDLIPLLHPEHCADFMPAVFEHWLRFVVAECDELVCISRAVADDLARWIARAEVPTRAGLQLGHVPLGSDLSEHADVPPPSSRVVGAMGGPAESVLMVGTIEPRKRHELVLDAFERLWEAGDRRRLVVVGKRGWNVDGLVARIQAHPEHGSRLHWINDATDADIHYAYGHAERVVQASVAEGFGLPVIEAARNGCAVLATDLPVFREVGDGVADFFRVDCIESLLESLSEPPRPPAVPHQWTWAASAEQVRKRLWSGPWDYVLS